MSVLKAENITVRMANREIIKDVEVCLSSNTLTAIIGPNGSGKTTLLRSLCGLQGISRGKISIKDKPLTSYSAVELSKTLSWVPSHTSIPFDFSCLDVVVLGRFGLHKGYPQKRDRAVAMETLKQLDVADFAHRSFSTLSSGEASRILIARALAAETHITLLDEPCANLDIAVAFSLLELLQNICAKGRVICLSLHDIGLARRFSHQIMIMSEGRVYGRGRTEDILIPQVVKEVFGTEAQLIELEQGQKTIVPTHRI